MTKVKNSDIQMVPNPAGKHVIPTRVEALNKLESKILKDLDPDKLSDLSEVLYAFNNYKVGPMDGFYMAVEVVSGKNGAWGNFAPIGLSR